MEQLFVMLMVAVLYVLAYVVGSIPTGWLLARFCGVDDIRKHGSGTMGATNVARVLGTRYFFVVFLIDMFKAFGYLVLLRQMALPDGVFLFAAWLLVLGNTRSLFLRGTGGKGVATAVGVLLALYPVVLLWIVPLWFVVFCITRTVGIASVVALASAPCVAFFLHADRGLLLLIAISFWSIYLHRNNIRRYIKAGSG